MGGDETLRDILRDASSLYFARKDASGEEEESQDLSSHVEFLQQKDSFSQMLPKELREHAASMRPPRDKVTCLLVGNHSAGKSSFVNWYLGESIQSESVAMETAGITIIRKGKKRTSWKGQQTLTAFPHLARLCEFPGMLDFLATEFTTSSTREAHCVELIDTPGLTDGTLKYPFAVDDAIMEAAEHANVVLVFLDPIGKALVERTMKLVERLSKRHVGKVFYCLSKFDTAGDQTDRVNVVSQIVQELQSRVASSHALKLYTIYIPDRADEATRKTCPNKIDELCQVLSNEVQARVQGVLDQVTKDCRAVNTMVTLKMDAHRRAVRHNRFASAWGLLLPLVIVPLLAAMVYWALLNVGGVDALLVCDDQHGRKVQLIRGDTTVWEERLEPTWNIFCFALTWFGGTPLMSVLLGALSASVFAYFVLTRRVPQLTAADMRALKRIREHVEMDIAAKQKALVKRLKRHAMGDEDDY
mmetsp:Transcript_24839/g.59623  ORF Transcript_24839/g.59623 Transcript_24839/m.59623 type:complete len:473 (+) Transcript_24839:80-1498(+)|eukprot:CAMPEP_0114120938 /NCGR_PEP_ID=MMETSP0043_2-20121206/6916_1 /TAXON_ID=464988 /ORGANISM="Hemiselmis andersenii, Strain CCMP644" /LENGTH=472 /DNA_ID=CAMNT_0001213595 /DNA_START=11 /DNA_END=1429 /DNA_ORIENTATION=-